MNETKVEKKVKTKVFVYKGVLGIQSDIKSEGLLNNPANDGQLGFVLDASKVEFQQEAIDWLKKVKPSSDDFGGVDVFKTNEGMIVFSWLGGPLRLCMNQSEIDGSSNYHPELLTATEGVEAPEAFKIFVDSKK